MCFPSWHQRLRPEAILEKLGDERGTVIYTVESWVVSRDSASFWEDMFFMVNDELKGH